MPRFYFRIFNGHGETPDEEGLELESQGAAHRIAVNSIRAMVAEEAKQGVIDLTGRIDIEDAVRNVLLRVWFTEAFALKVPEDPVE